MNDYEDTLTYKSYTSHDKLYFCFKKKNNNLIKLILYASRNDSQQITAIFFHDATITVFYTIY